jgi:hypothetical protein
MEIARSGYHFDVHAAVGSDAQTSVAFFPLYPLIARLLGLLFGSIFLSGLLISSICAIGASVLLYRLARLDHDEATAMRSVRYLYAFPMAFVLSAFLTEALFLCLSLGCLYSARKQRWFLSGSLGLLAALTRPVGVLLVLPMLVECAVAHGFRRCRVHPDILWMLLVPLGTCLFGLYCWHLTTDFLAFSHVQTAWGRHLADPVYVLCAGLLSPNLNERFSSWFTTVFLLWMIHGVRSIRWSYWLLGMALILAPLATGSTMSMPRFLVPAFPLYLVCARTTKSAGFHEAALIALAFLQGCLMGFRTNAFAISM